MRQTPPAAALRTLVAGLVDYAGLFPPAALTMGDAVAGYAAHLQAPERWMLGRFVVTAARLGELADAVESRIGAGRDPWPVSALLGDDLVGDVARVASMRARAGTIAVEAIELRATSAGAIRDAVRLAGGTATIYVELPLVPDPRPLLAVVRAVGARAKVRTGGVTADAFPTAATLAQFIVRCAELGVPFKATAGLHHPLRAEHRLTYQPEAAEGTMFGFINVFVAAAFAHGGEGEALVAEVLEERSADAFQFDAGSLCWRGHALSLGQLQRTRDSFAISFGSCSFREPVDDLHALGLL